MFTEITFCVSQVDQRLMFLSFAGGNPVRETSALPSWVVDFTTSQSPVPLFLAHAKIPSVLSLSATRDMPFMPPRIGMCQPLHLQGIYLDSIVDDASSYNSIERGERKSWIALALRLNTPYCTGQGRTEVLWRTLLADVTSESHPAPETHGGRFSSFLFIRAIMVRDYKLLRVFFFTKMISQDMMFSSKPCTLWMPFSLLILMGWCLALLELMRSYLR